MSPKGDGLVAVRALCDRLGLAGCRQPWRRTWTVKLDPTGRESPARPGRSDRPQRPPRPSPGRSKSGTWGSPCQGLAETRRPPARRCFRDPAAGRGAEIGDAYLGAWSAEETLAAVWNSPGPALSDPVRVDLDREFDAGRPDILRKQRERGLKQVSWNAGIRVAGLGGRGLGAG